MTNSVTPAMIDAAEANIREDRRAGKISKEQFQKEMLIVASARHEALADTPPQTNTQPSDDLLKAVMNAIVSCGHEIDHDSVVLKFSERQGGRNAYSQLNDRVEKAIGAAAPAPQNHMRAAADRINVLEAALRRIAKWHGEFPETGKFWDDEHRKEPMSYVACYGSNGERDFMRDLAQKALDVAPASPQTNLAPDFRKLAVDIVDGIRGYTFEFSSHPAAHKDDYDFIEEKLRATLVTTEGQP